MVILLIAGLLRLLRNSWYIWIPLTLLFLGYGYLVTRSSLIAQTRNLCQEQLRFSQGALQEGAWRGPCRLERHRPGSSTEGRLSVFSKKTHNFRCKVGSSHRAIFRRHESVLFRATSL